MERAEIVLLLIPAVLLHLFFGHFFAIYGSFIFITLVGHELYEYAGNAYCQIVGALTLKKRLNSYGRWAVVTGCTRGLGKEFCLQLAQAGLDIVLIGRKRDLLDKLELEIRQKYGVETVKIQADFSGGHEATYETIRTKLSELEGNIGILVNNVGVFYDTPRYFHEVSEKDLMDTVNVNIVASLRLSHMVIKDHMLHRHNGLVVFLGSSSAVRPIPFFNAYASSKIYVEHLALSLHEEYKPHGVHVQVLMPGFVLTDMAHYAATKPRLMVPTVQTYVKKAVEMFGMNALTAAYFPHQVQMVVWKRTPQWLFLYFGRDTISAYRDHWVNRGPGLAASGTIQ